MKTERRFTAFRIEAQLVERITQVAAYRKCSTRSVVEVALEEALPRMEREAGLEPGGPSAAALKKEIRSQLARRRTRHH
jgi:hypothetical protein